MQTYHITDVGTTQQAFTHQTHELLYLYCRNLKKFKKNKKSLICGTLG